MKQRLIPFIMTIAIMIVITIFFGCKKNSISRISSETQVYLVSENIAKQVAEKFNSSMFSAQQNNYSNSATTITQTNSNNSSSNQNSLNGHNTIKNYFVINDSAGIPAIYVFNYANNGGSLFVSADFHIAPILAYIEHGETPQNFGNENQSIPYGATIWTHKILSDYRLVRTGMYNNSSPAYTAWNNYMSSNNITPPNGFTSYILPIDPGTGPGGCANYTVIILFQQGPLLNVTWGQSCTYNNQCPLMNCTGCDQNTLTGCVATAMSQVIDYWHPVNNHNYNYASMPIASGNTEVQRLMHDAGVSVNMIYGCLASSIYTSAVPNVAISLRNNFGLASANYVSGFDLNRCTVQNLLNGWPVLLGGVDPNIGEGHEWVCDGYQTATTYCGNTAYNLLHMNWGWHEVGTLNDFNGWFVYNNWTVNHFNPSTYQSMIAEIHN